MEEGGWKRGYSREVLTFVKATWARAVVKQTFVKSDLNYSREVLTFVKITWARAVVKVTLVNSD